MTAVPEHSHVPGCQAVWFDDSGAYRGTRAFDIDNCATCRTEAGATTTEGDR